MKKNNNQYTYNLNANSYVPKNKDMNNQQYENNNYYNQGYNNYYNQGQSYTNNQYYQEYDNNYNNNYYYDNSQNYGNYQNQNYYPDYNQNSQNFNPHDSQQQNYYQDSNKNKGKKNYLDKNEFKNKSTNNTTNYDYEVEKTYGNNKINFNSNKYDKGNKNKYSNNKNEYYYEEKSNDYYENNNKYNKQNKNVQQEEKNQKIEVIQRVVDSSGNQKVQVIQKDYNEKSKPIFQQDLEDDHYDEETFGESNFNEYDDREELYDDDLYDYADREGGNYNEEFDDVIEEDFGVDKTFNDEKSFKKGGYKNSQKRKFEPIEEITDKFSKNLSISNSSSAYKQTSSNIKNNLIFENTESFTDYVDRLMSSENKKYSQDISDSFVNVLMIAEKPSIAKSIADALASSKYKTKTAGRGKTIINFDGYFGNAKAKFTVSSVMGHVYTSDFQREHNQWSAIDALDLYQVPIVKLEANPKTRIPSFISSLASGKDILCLWLDCDKEGENICFEVINNTFKYMNKKSYQQIYRAKFSSLTKQDLKIAFNNLKERPNKNESLSVDVRQVIDLKIGVSFTRFLTSSILPGLKEEEIKLISYGPCQTPTLWFCVNRQKEINSFIPKEYFRIYTDVEVKKIKKRIYYEKNFYDKKSTNDFLLKFNETKKAKVIEVEVKLNQKTPPAGMNTVQMLRIASSYLKISPHHTMVIAEKLYTMGYVTYPRTETTKYAPSFDFKKSLSDFSQHPVFGTKINSHILKNYQRPILKGVDVGDHPPITPAKVADQSELKGDYWRLYELICTNFFASLAPPAEYEERINTILIENEIFVAESMNIVKDGFLAFMPWKRGNYIKDFPILTKEQEININSVTYESKWTEPPTYLSESDLIKLMEKNKIGTDASMPVHIENICNRGYVEVDEGRKLIPTNLGKALIESLSIVDPELVKPTVRAEIELLVESIAKGKKLFSEILKYSLDLYKNKFLLVRQNYEKMIAQFRRYFTVDTAGITSISKNIKKQNTEYRSQIQVKKGEKEIQESIVKDGCVDCKNGKMYIDYDSFDKFILLCTACKLRKKLIRDAVKIDIDRDCKCPECNSYFCCVEIQYPLITGEKKLTGCLFCDDRINYGL